MKKVHYKKVFGKKCYKKVLQYKKQCYKKSTDPLIYVPAYSIA